MLIVTPDTVPSNDAFIVNVPGSFDVSVFVATPLPFVVTVSLPLRTPLHEKSMPAPETPVQVVPSLVCSNVAVNVCGSPTLFVASFGVSVRRTST